MKHGYPLLENGEIVVWTEYESLFKGRIFTKEQENTERSRTDCIEDGISNEDK
jgi:hypothetical protein